MSGELHWIPAEGGYQLALDGAKLICRNAAGKRLRSVPKAVKDGQAAEDLRALRDHLARHAATCLATVESWMLGALPVPAAVIAQVWPDPAWREPLSGLVVTQHPEGAPGLLEDVDDQGRPTVARRDGESVPLAPGPVLIPHPVLLGDLGGLRAFAAGRGAGQRVPQLDREVYHRGDGPIDYAGGRFAELRHATTRAARFGFQVRGGFAVCRVADGGRPLQARYWLGADAPDAEAYTGGLHWVDGHERTVDAGSLGPVAWSEGVRMAELIYAGRSTGVA
ncbi:DUF4132 domain-containing protein [Nonomuraea sp. NBC_01738]|uniref:DUF4132 domain-containing protein n=1 Tax=Nonomuraea sp. NBC_01738 TaxID=2976003 RepID=UPI002E16783E|nr:DUF4132 domain-containing protein [Nonomuraea sp. NBC_01738]